MKINILSMYPEIFDGFKKNPIVGRAINNDAVTINYIDIKEHTAGCYRKLDDSPYGGAKGMILRVDAVDNALSSVKTNNSHVVLLSPKGSVFDQKKAKELASYSDLIVICGHYEGLDARIESLVDEQISIGDFILSGGENAACVICDSIIRLLPGVLKEGVADDESFESGLLECKQYTHPSEYDGMSVPSVLMSGNKAEIEKYKRISSLMETAKYRPDLLYKYGKKETIGCSSASILMFKDMVMKIGSSQQEKDMMEFLSGKIGVPEVFDCYYGDQPYLLMSKIEGRMLCDNYYLSKPDVVISIVVKALKQLWDVDVSNCPYDMGPDNKLKIAKYNIEQGLADFSEAEGFNSREELYQWLCDNKPELDPVFSHGDLCLPNIIISKKDKLNYIDLGLAGVGDRYCDIALCLRSIKRNLPNLYLDYDKFFNMIGIKPNYDKLKWYTLLDELY